VVEDSGPDPTIVYHTEEDYDAVVRSLLARKIHGRLADVEQTVEMT